MARQRQNTGTGDIVGQAFAVAGAWVALGVTAGEVIGQRMALGAASLCDPVHADYAEFTRMVAEKPAVFGASLLAANAEALRIGGAATHMVAVETEAAMAAVTTAAWGGGAAAGQCQLMEGVAERSLANFATLAALMGGMQTAAIAPLQRAVAGNAKRLRGR